MKTVLCVFLIGLAAAASGAPLATNAVTRAAPIPAKPSETSKALALLAPGTEISKTAYGYAIRDRLGVRADVYPTHYGFDIVNRHGKHVSVYRSANGWTVK